jgi:hypothetical protein
MNKISSRYFSIVITLVYLILYAKDFLNSPLTQRYLKEKLIKLIFGSDLSFSSSACFEVRLAFILDKVKSNGHSDLLF